MEDLTALLDYFKKIQRLIDNPDFSFLKYRFVKKTRIDDLLVCTLAILPDSFKKAMKRSFKIDTYPSVSCYNRLSKILKKKFVLAPDFYMIDYTQAHTMLQNIRKNLESDIRKLEDA